MFVFKKYDRQNHVWSFMTKYLRFPFTRVEVEKHPQVILAMYFFFILDKNNELPDWMTD